MFHKAYRYPTHWLRKFLNIFAAETPHCWKISLSRSLEIEPHDLIIETYRLPRLMRYDICMGKTPHASRSNDLCVNHSIAHRTKGGGHIFKFERFNCRSRLRAEMSADGCRFSFEAACDSRCAQVPATWACDNRGTAERFVHFSTALAAPRICHLDADQKRQF